MMILAVNTDFEFCYNGQDKTICCCGSVVKPTIFIIYNSVNIIHGQSYADIYF